MRLGNEILVDVYPDRRLVAQAGGEICKNTINHFLTDQVIPRAIAGEGQLVIHAGAIVKGAGAVLLIGASGRGKSTLTTSFHIAGNVMLGDDAIVIELKEDGATAMAVYPSLRLLPDSIEALVPEHFENDRVSQASSKRQVLVPLDGLKQTAAPVRAIFVLGPPRDGSASVRRLGPAEACMAIVQNSFALDPADVGAARARLDQASALIRTVPAFEIVYPRSYDCLGAVRDTILHTLGRYDAAIGGVGVH